MAKVIAVFVIIGKGAEIIGKVVGVAAAVVHIVKDARERFEAREMA